MSQARLVRVSYLVPSGTAGIVRGELFRLLKCRRKRQAAVAVGGGGGPSEALARLVDSQLTALLGPAQWGLADAHQLDRAQIGRMASLEDHLGDIGREKAQPEHAREVGVTDAHLDSDILDRPIFAGCDEIAEAPRLSNQPQQAALRLARDFRLPLLNSASHE